MAQLEVEQLGGKVNPFVSCVMSEVPVERHTTHVPEVAAFTAVKRNQRLGDVLLSSKLYQHMFLVLLPQLLYPGLRLHFTSRDAD
jgi:hypothetical protein